MRKDQHICQAMGVTLLNYHNCRENYFARWCSHYAESRALPMRDLLRSEALHAWFCDQWRRKVELPFYMDHHEYMEAGLQDFGNFQDLFLMYAEEIDPYFPKPILEAIANRYKLRSQL